MIAKNDDVINRMTPERRIFYIDIGELNAVELENVLSKVRDRLESK